MKKYQIVITLVMSLLVSACIPTHNNYKIYQRTQKSVLKLECINGKNFSSGTGFFESMTQYIVTSAHVVESCQKINAHHNASSFELAVLTTDSPADIAILKPKSALPFSTTGLQLANSPALPTDDVFIWGTEGKNGILNFKTGTIAPSIDSSNYLNAIINPGNSGGPILNAKGEVIGIIAARTGNETQQYGLGLYVDLIKNKNRFFSLLKIKSKPDVELGMKTKPTSITINNNTKSGLQITYIDPNGLAFKYGLRIKDVIISIDEETTITHTYLKNLLKVKYSDDHIMFKVIRDDKIERVEIIL